MQGIYKIVNKVNGKYYVGSAKDIELRFKEHCNSLEKGNHYNVYLQRAWNKYGGENFQLAIHKIFSPETNREELYEIEQIILDECFLNDKIYNVSHAACGGCGSHSEETRIKIGITGLGRVPWNKDLKNCFSEEVCQQLSESHKGQVPWNKGKTGHLSAKTLRMMGNRHIGQVAWNKGVSGEDSHRYGIKHTDETRDLMSINSPSAKPYPAFRNIKSGICISAGHNLKRMCRELGLNWDTMWNLSRGATKCSRDGWVAVRE